MADKQVLVIMRHTIDDIQRMLIRSIHGKRAKIVIDKRLRFDNMAHFLKFMYQNQDNYYIYVVIPEEWRKTAIELDISIGVLHRPYEVLKKTTKKTEYRVQFFFSQRLTVEKILYSKIKKRCRRDNRWRKQ